MNTPQSIFKKKQDGIQFAIHLDWLELKRAMITSKEVEGSIHVATPAIFGGTGAEWSPEHLFVSAVASCFFTTYLYFADKMGFNVSHLTCNANGEVSLREGKYLFTHIDIYPKICVADEALIEKAHTALVKAEAYCLIANSVNAAVKVHGEVVKDPHPKYLQQG